MAEASDAGMGASMGARMDAGMSDSMIELLARLVGFDTTSRNSNLALIDFVADYLAAHGVASQRVESDDATKASLFATIGPGVEGGVILSGHTDVVPVDDQDWTADPFTLTRRGERLHGRGACDMKGFIACVLAVVPELARMPLKVPVHLALSYDEELGCAAAPALIAALLAAVPRPAFAIIGEPTEMRVAQSHRGISSFATTVSGRTGHSSKPAAGVNAILAACSCIAELDRLAAAAAASAGAAGAEPLTLNVGRIEGGSAVNVIAGRCRFLWEARAADQAEVDRLSRRFANWVGEVLLPPLRLRAPEAGVTTERRVAVPPLVAIPHSPAVAAALALSGQNSPVGAPFATEAGQFQAAGVPSVVIGPGSVAQAHQPDEFVTRAQLDACLTFLRRLADRISHGAGRETERAGSG